MEKNNFFAYLNRLKYINRWGLMKNNSMETLSEHSLQTAIIAHGLALIEREIFHNDEINVDKIALQALYHDCSEIFTGDLPTPIKYYNNQIKQAYKSIEDTAENKLLSYLPSELTNAYTEYIKIDESSINHKIVKAADKISALIKCEEEVNGGNREFIKAQKANREAVDALDLPSVKYFMTNFFDSFKLSLDEMD